MGWEPWTGCYKISDGCTYCYYYGPYSKRYGQNTIVKTEEFYKPREMKTKTKPKIESGANVPVCFATDFFLPEADPWRLEAWEMMRERPDVHFTILTKRIDRFLVSLPRDWGAGPANITIGCTVENQALADYRLPLFLSYPIKHRFISCTPLLGPIELQTYLHGVEQVTTGGETSRDARTCDLAWIASLRDQCEKAGCRFWFKNTGSHLLLDGEVRKINPRVQHSMARGMGWNLPPEEIQEGAEA